MPKIVEEDGFVISWGRRSKKALNSTPASSPSLSSSKELLAPEKRADPRWEGDTGLAGLLESD